MTPCHICGWAPPEKADEEALEEMDAALPRREEFAGSLEHGYGLLQNMDCWVPFSEVTGEDLARLIPIGGER